MNCSLLQRLLSKSFPVLSMEGIRSGALGTSEIYQLATPYSFPFDSYALYSGLSPGFQKYLEGLQAVHSAAAQAQGSRAAGLPVRRHEVESIHPLVRVHPATGWKAVYVNPGE